MTSTSLDLDLTVLEELDQSWDIMCEVPALRALSPFGWPPCQEGPAEWIMWKDHACGGACKYRLLCDVCKQTYEAWFAKGAHITCSDCGWDRQIDTLNLFTRLDAKR